MFLELSQPAMEYFLKMSNKKLAELTNSWNEKNPDKKPKTVNNITNDECLAFLAAVIHMGLSNKTDWKFYWSKMHERNDDFIRKLNIVSGKLSMKQNKLS